MFHRFVPTPVAVGLGATGAAQEATPGVEFPEELVAPDPSECRVAPRTVESLTALVATPPAATPAPPDFEALVREGEPADAATVAAVTATVREIYACLNANAPLQMYALIGDDALRQLLPGLPPAASVDPAGTPAPRPEEDRTAVRVRDVRVLADGRATAFVDGFSPDGTFALFGVFVRQGDRFVLQAWIASAPQRETPAARGT